MNQCEFNSFIKDRIKFHYYDYYAIYYRIWLSIAVKNYNYFFEIIPQNEKSDFFML